MSQLAPINLMIIKNFLGKQECSTLLSLLSEMEHRVNNLPEDIIDYYTSDFSIISKSEKTCKLSLRYRFEDDILRKKLNDALKNYSIYKFDKDNLLFGHKFAFVKYYTGSSLPKHIDKYMEDNGVLSVVIYLNDDYIHGETYFEDGTIISKETGTMLIFNGTKIYHGSRPVTGEKNVIVGKLIYQCIE